MKENRFVAWIRRHLVCSIVIALLFFIVVIPVLINLCYSCDHVLYATQWGAADVLIYYGAILGATVTAACLAGTIRFNIKQIEYSSIIKDEHRKWETLETQVDMVLETLAPMNMNVDFENEFSFFDIPRRCAHRLRLYRLNANNAVNRLVILTLSNTSSDLQKLIEVINKANVEFCNFASEEIKLYDQIIAENSKCIISDAALIAKCNERIDNLDYLLGKQYVPYYHQLLREKQSTFDTIYEKIDREANKHLHI